MKRLFKKILYLFSKRLIRFLVYFSIISCVFVSTCFGASTNYYYDSFSDLVGGGKVFLYAGVDYDLLNFGSVSSGYDDITVAYNNTRFNSFGVLIGSNEGVYPTVSGTVSPNDVFMLEHYIRINCERGSAYYGQNEITNNIYLTLFTDNGDIIISGRDFYDDLEVISSGSGTDEDTILLHVKVNYKFTSYTFVRGIRYNFLQAFDSPLASCTFIPVSLEKGYLYYLGDSQGAPVFSDFTDFSDEVSSFIGIEDELFNSVDVKSYFIDFSSWMRTFQSSYYYAFAFNFLSTIINSFYNNVLPIKLVLQFSIYFGLILLLLGGVASAVSYSVRRFRK